MDYREFTVTSSLNGEVWHCRFHTLIVGIAPRHSNSVDVRFLVNGKPIAIALAHPGFAIFKQRTRVTLNDADSIQMAGLYLKNLLERGERIEDPIIPVSVDHTLALAQQIRGVAFS